MTAELTRPLPPVDGAPPGFPITVRGVSRWFGSVVALSDVSFDVPPGITGLIGPNGAGKTTLLRVIAGLISPSQGEVHLFGERMRRQSALYRRLTLIMDRDALYPMLTAREFVRLNARMQGMADDAAVTRALTTVDLLSAADRRLGGFSKGMRQRVRLAAGLVHDPDVVLLDEPFAGADPRQRRSLMGTLAELAVAGRTIVFSSHILDEVEELAAAVLVINHGKLAAAGAVSAIRQAMLDRPHQIRVRAADPRGLAAVLVRADAIAGIAIDEAGTLRVQVKELGAAARLIPRLARDAGIRLFEVSPEDESLDRVFEYLVGK